MKKKVLFAINTMGRGGAEVAMLALMNHPEMAEHDLSLYVMLGQGELISRLPDRVRLLNRNFESADVLSKEGKRVMYRQVAKCILSRGAAVRDLPYMTVNAVRMLRSGGIKADKLLWRAVADGAQRLRDEYDLAVAYIEGGSTYYVSRRVRAKRKVAFVHVDYRQAGYTRELDRGCYDAFDSIFCVSDEVRTAFLSVYPEYADKTAVFHNLIDRERILEMADKGEGFSDGYDGPRLLTVGRLVPQKAIELSVEAMAILRDRGVRARWYVFGEGEERAALEKKIAEAGLEQDFLLPGVTDNPYPYYKQTDLYVHCSRFEGRSIAIQEAQTLGCCVIVSDCSGNREQVIDGVDGILTELSPPDMADAIQRALTDEALRTRLGKAAAERRFDTENIEMLLSDKVKTWR